MSDGATKRKAAAFDKAKEALTQAEQPDASQVGAR
jgi:hypothetical protein